MPNTTEADLFEQFKKWGNSPDTELPQTPPAPMGAVESGLWLAYRAGYLQALRDSEAVQRVAVVLENGKP